MEYIISDHNVPIKLRKILKKIVDEDKEFSVDFLLYINQSEPTEAILGVPISNSEIKNFEIELKEAILNIFNKYKKKLENNS